MEYHKATLKNVIYIVIYSISSIKGEKPRRTANLHHLDTKGQWILSIIPSWKE